MNALLLLALLAALPAQDDPDKKGKLSEFEQPLHKRNMGKTEKKQDDDAPGVHHDSCDDDSNILGEMFGEVFGPIIAAPFIYPCTDQELRFDDYPFAHGRRYFRTPEESEKMFAADLEVETGRIEHDLLMYESRLTLRLPSGFDFHYDASQWVEDLPGINDRLTIQQFHFDYGIGTDGKSRPVQGTLGFGAALLDANGFHDQAPTVQAGVTWFIRRPFSAELRASLMGFKDATISDVSFEFGLHLDRFSLTAGVRTLHNSAGDDLTGPTLGLSVNF